MNNGLLAQRSTGIDGPVGLLGNPQAVPLPARDTFGGVPHYSETGPLHWRRWKQHLDDTANARPPVTVTVTTIGAAVFSGGGAHIGGVMLLDGRIFCCPWNARACIFDIRDNQNTVTTVGQDPGPRLSRGGLLLPDGRVFCMLWANYTDDTKRMAIYDPVRDEFAAAGPPDVLPTGDGAFGSCCLMADGRIFLCPFGEVRQAWVYDPKADNYYPVGAPVSFPVRPTDSTGTYVRPVLMADGRIFCVPSSVRQALIYDPDTNRVTNAGPPLAFPGTWGQGGGLLMPDGRVFCHPLNTTSARIYDPKDDTVRAIAGFPSNFAYHSGTTLPDGRVLCVPTNSTQGRLYNPVTNVVASVTGYLASDAHFGCVALPDGRVLSIPYNNTQARIFGRPMPVTFNINWYLSPYSNKT